MYSQFDHNIQYCKYTKYMFQGTFTSKYFSWKWWQKAYCWQIHIQLEGICKQCMHTLYDMMSKIWYFTLSLLILHSLNCFSKVWNLDCQADWFCCKAWFICRSSCNSDWAIASLPITCCNCQQNKQSNLCCYTSNMQYSNRLKTEFFSK